MTFSEDLSVFFADFGVIAQGGTCTVNGSSVEGIFDQEYLQQSFMVDGSKPALLVRSADISGVARNAPVVIKLAAWSAAVNYTVADKQPDGTGMTLLILDKA